MRANFNPTREAARRHSLPAAPLKANPACAPVTKAKCCELPRGVRATGSRSGIWRALQEIQIRHA
jgi:hypothetical protein